MGTPSPTQSRSRRTLLVWLSITLAVVALLGFGRSIALAASAYPAVAQSEGRVTPDHSIAQQPDRAEFITPALQGTPQQALCSTTVGQLSISSIGISNQPSINANGSRVAFWSTSNLPSGDVSLNNADGNIEVFMYRRSATSFTQISNTTGSILGGFNLSPSINGDGSRVAFFSDRDILPGQNSDGNFEIFLAAISASGSASITQVTRTTGGANILPSINGAGNRIAFVSDRDLTGSGLNDDRNLEVFLAQIAGNGSVTFHQITNSVRGLNDQPVISTDGNYITFVSDHNHAGSNSDGNREIFRATISSPASPAFTQVTVTSRANNIVNDQPAISQDGSVLAFISNGYADRGNADGNLELFSARIASNNSVTISAVTSTNSSVTNERPSISHDGSRIAFASTQDGNREIYLRDSVAGTTVQITNSSGGSNEQPTLSGNGTTLAFVSDRNQSGNNPEANREIFTTLCPFSDLALSGSASPSVVTAGTPLTYTLTVTNHGPSPDSGIVLTETVPVRTTFHDPGNNSGWSCPHGSPAGTVCSRTVGGLEAGESRASTFTVMIDSDAPNGYVISNAPFVRGTSYDRALVNNNPPPITTSVARLINLALDKSAAPSVALPGGLITYTLNVSNGGPSDATGVMLTDTLPAHTTYVSGGSYNATTNDITWSLGSVAEGTQTSRQLVVRVDTPLPAGVALITNSATVRDDGTSGDPLGNNTRTITTEVNAEPRFQLTKSDGSVRSTPGTVIPYQLSYSNTGNQGATGVRLTEIVPANSTFNNAASTAGWSCPNGSAAGVTCTLQIGNLNAGAAGSAVFAVRVRPAIPSGIDQIENTARISDDGANSGNNQPVEAQAMDRTPLDAAPDLIIQKDDNAGNTQPGDTLSYSLAYENAGNQDAVGVRITETVPANTTFTSSGSSSGWSCANGSPAGTTCIYMVNSLAVGGSGTVAFAARVVAPVPSGVEQITNSVSIGDDGSNGADPVPSNNIDSEMTPVFAAPDLQLSKHDNGLTALPGGLITYTLSYANVGNQNASGVRISETVPANTRFLSSGSSSGWSCPNNSPAGTICSRTIGNVGAGATTAPLRFVVRVESPLSAGITQINNSAIIGDDGIGGSDQTPGDNTATDTTPVNAAPSFTIAKNDGGVTAVPGELVTYTLSYSNNGNQNATGVRITETVPAHTRFYAASSTSGWSCANNSAAGATCVYNIGNLGAGASTSPVQFVVRVVDPVSAGVAELSNTVRIADDGSNGSTPAPISATDSELTPLLATPVLEISKDDGGRTALLGNIVPYTITYSNTGDQNATGVVITETVPAHSTFNSAASSSGWSCANNSPAGTTCRLTVGSLTANGTNRTALFAVRVNSVIPAGVHSLVNDVRIADDGNNGNSGVVSAADSDVTPILAEPELAISKSDGGLVEVDTGEEILYTITVTNTGTQDATNVVLTDAIPANTSFVAGSASNGGTVSGGVVRWNISLLPINSPITRTFRARVNATIPAGTSQISNTASVTDDGANSNTPGAPKTATITIATTLAARPEFNLIKDDGGLTTTPGSVVFYTLTVRNDGNQGATGIVLTDTLPSQLTYVNGSASHGGNHSGGVITWNIGALNAGASATRTFRATVSSTLASGVDYLVNVATTSDDGNNNTGAPVTDSATSSTPVQAEPALELTKTDGPASSVGTNGLITYTLTVANSGNQTAAGVRITETVPANTRFVSAGSSAGWSCANNSPAGTICSRLVGTVAAGASTAPQTFVVRVNTSVAAGVTAITNTAHTGDNGLNSNTPGLPITDTASDSKALVAEPDLVITKSDGNIASIGTGDEIQYTITITNSGDQAATGVRLTDTLPANTVYVPGSASGSGISDGTNVTWTIGALAVNQSVSRTFRARVADSVPTMVDEIINSARTSDDGANSNAPGTPVEATTTIETVLIAAPDLAISKDDGITNAQPDEIVTYTITFVNDGDQAASAVRITDTIPANTSYVNGSASDGGVYSGGTVRWTISLLAVDQPLTRSFQVRVNTPLPNGVDAITNTVAIGDNGANTGSVPVTATASHMTVIDAAPVLQLSKADSAEYVKPGDVLTYTLRITNTGNQGAVAITLVDTIPASTSYVAGSASDGGSFNSGTGEITWAIPSLAAGASAARSFRVTVDSTLPLPVTITNDASVADNGANTGGVPVTATSNTTSATMMPDLSISKSASPEPVVAGDEITYTIQYTNAGPSLAQNLRLTDSLPANVIFGGVVSGPAPDSVNGSAVVWNRPTLAPAGTATIVFTATVGSQIVLPAITNAVTLSSQTPDRNPSNNQFELDTVVSTVADLSIDLTDQPSTVLAGEVVTYTVTYQNSGPSDAQSTVITATLPEEVVYGGRVSPISGLVESTGAGTVTWSRPTLGAGITREIVFTATVLADTTAGTMIAGVEIQSATSDPATANNSASETTSIQTAADLSVNLEGMPATVNAGETLTYTLEYTNHGPSRALSLDLTATLPSSLVYNGTISASPAVSETSGPGQLAWSLPALDPGVTGEIVFSVNARPDTPVGNITTSATVNATTADPDPSNNSTTDQTLVQVRADLRVTMRGVPTSVIAGMPVTYTINYTNTGPSAAQNIRITDTLPAGMTFGAVVSATPPLTTQPSIGQNRIWTLPGLAAGASGSLVLTATVNSNVTANSLTNSVTIRAQTPDPVANNTASVVTTVTRRADMQISLSDDPATAVVAGNFVTYTLFFTNNGPSDARDVVLTNVHPPQMNNGSFSVITQTSTLPAHSRNMRTVTWTAGTIPAGASGFATFRVRVTSGTSQGTVLTDDASVATTTTDPVSSNNSASEQTTVMLVSDMQASISDSPGTTVAAGRSITYTINYGNGGISDAATVRITATLPLSVTYGGTLSETPSITGPTVNGSQLVWTRGTMPADATGQLVFTATVSSAVPAGTSLITPVEISSAAFDPSPGNNSDTAQVTVTSQADLSISGTDNPSTVAAGERLTYTLTYQNQGPSGADEVEFSTVLPAGVTFDAVQSQPASLTGPASSGSSLTWDAGSVAPGTSGTVVFTVLVAANQSAGSSLTLNSSISSTTPDPAGGNNADSETTQVINRSDLSISLDASPEPVIAGEVITYTFTYTNAGPSTATTVRMTDSLPANVTYGGVVSQPAALSGPTQSGSMRVWTMGSLAAGSSGTVVFTATVGAGVADGSTRVNQVSIGSAAIDPNPTSNSDSVSSLVSTEADLSVTLSAVPVPVVAGETITYTVGYTNGGPSNATNFEVINTLPSGVTFGGVVSQPGLNAPTQNGQEISWSASSLPANVSRTLIYTATVNADVMPGSTLVNEAVLTADTDSTLASQTSAQVISIVATAVDLEIVGFSDTPDPVSAGSTLTYTLAYRNNGPSYARSITATVLLPAALDYSNLIEANPAVTAIEGANRVTFTLPMIAANSTGQIIFTGQVTSTAPSGSLSTSAFLDSATTEVEDDNNDELILTTVNTRADLELVSLVDSPEPVVAGGPLTYTLNYRNNGPSVGQSLSITAALPGQLTFDGLISSSPAVNAISSGGIVTFTTPSLGTGATGQIVFGVDVAADTSNGATLLTNARVRGATNDPTALNNGRTASTTVQTQSDLELLGLAVSPAPVTAGEEASYTLSYRNNGPSDAAGLVITTTLPSGVTFGSVTSASPAATALSSSGVVTFTVPALGANATGQIVFDTEVEASVPDSATLVSTGGIFSAGPDPIGGNNYEQTTFLVEATADLAITLDDYPDTVVAGEPVSYTLSYSNPGPSDAENISISATLPISISYDSMISGPAPASVSGSGRSIEWTLPSLPAGTAGTIEFTSSTGTDIPDGNVQATALASSSTVDTVPANNSTAAQTEIITSANLAVTTSAASYEQGVAIGSATITYTISYTNSGPSDAVEVVLTDSLPVSVTFGSVVDSTGLTDFTRTGQELAWTRDRLAAGTSGTAVITGTVSSGVISGTTILTNGSEISSAVTDSAPANNSHLLSTSVKDPGLDLAVSTTRAVDESSRRITYTISYANVGTVPATAVRVTHTLASNTDFVAAASGSGWQATAGGACVLASPECFLNLGALAPGQSGTRVLVVQWNQGGTLTALTRIGAGSGAPEIDLSNNSRQDTVDAPELDLRVTMNRVVNNSPMVRLITYTLYYTNSGAVPVVGARLTDTLPADTDFVVAGSTTGWMNNSGPGACNNASTTCSLNIGNLNAGASGTAVIVLRWARGGAISNTAMIGDNGSRGLDVHTSNNSATATATIPLSLNLAMSATSSSNNSTQRITYTVFYTNVGTEIATGVELTMTVPDRTRYVVTTPNWRSTANPANGCPTTSASVNCSFFPDLNGATAGNGALMPGSSGSVTFVVEWQSHAPSLVSTSSGVRDDGTHGVDANQLNNRATVTATTPPFDLAVSMTSSLANAGRDVRYSITVSNVGQQTATSIRVSDLVPSGFTFRDDGSTDHWYESDNNSASDNQCANGYTATCYYYIGTLAPGSSSTFTIQLRGPNSPTSVTNSVTVYAIGPSPNGPPPDVNTANNTAAITRNTNP